MDKQLYKDMDNTSFVDEHGYDVKMLYTVEIVFNNGKREYIHGLPSIFDIVEGLDEATKDNKFWFITDYKIINPNSIATIDIHEDPNMNYGMF